MDLYSGYHQILMDEESVEITTFTTKFINVDDYLNAIYDRSYVHFQIISDYCKT